MLFAAVIVSYNPDASRLSQTVGELCRQGFHAIVVDNASRDIDSVRQASQGAQLVELSENQGIAAALNEGMRVAHSSGAAWVLSLDQDSEVAPNMLQEYMQHLNLPSVGALCPAIVKRGEGVPVSGRGITEVERCPTTGFLLSVGAWEDVGIYDEWMFIDYVDYDMCIRLRIAGYKIYRTEGTYVVQELGKMSVHRFPYAIGKTLGWRRLQNFATTYNHSPLRNYYYVRNSLYYIRKYRNHIDARAEAVKLVKWELKKILLEGQKVGNAKALFKGIRDSSRKQ